MIVGVGIDLVDIRRIEKSYARFGTKFIEKIFTDTEQERSNARADRLHSYARRFAAKEACVKALRSGMYHGGIGWRDIAVENNAAGAPSLRLTGAAAKRLESLIPKKMTSQLSLSITDEYPYAQAIVILSAVPDNR